MWSRTTYTCLRRRYGRVLRLHTTAQLPFIHRVRSLQVLEAVSFAARSRLPETMTEAERSAIVQRVLTLLDLTPIAGQQVGLIGGLNPEQRKCVTIPHTYT